MKLFLQLQWQQSRFLFFCLLVLSCAVSFIIPYDTMEIHIIIFVCNVSLAAIFTPNRVIASRSMFHYMRSLPVTKEAISKYFIYSQLVSILFYFLVCAPHHFYAAHVQQKWTLFTVSYCCALCFCLIVHALLLPSNMRKMQELSVLEGVAITLPILLVCFCIGAFIFEFFRSSAIVLSILFTLLVCFFYVYRLRKNIRIHIYEYSDI